MTLFKATSGGDDWGAYYDQLSEVGWLPPLIFIVYLLFSFIAAWNIVSSIFIEKVLSLAQPGMEQQLLQKQRRDYNDSKELETLIVQAEEDRSGKVSMAEFARLMEDPRCSFFFELRGLSMLDAEVFFTL